MSTDPSGDGLSQNTYVGHGGLFLILMQVGGEGDRAQRFVDDHVLMTPLLNWTLPWTGIQKISGSWLVGSIPALSS